MTFKSDYLETDSLSDYLKKLYDFPLLSAEKEKELAFKIRAGDNKARSEFITSNLRLVVNRAKLYAHRGLPLKDLINEGNCGLSIAVDRYDPDYKNQFSAYAVWWIDQSIKKAIYEKSNLIKLPNWVSAKKRYLEELINYYPELSSLNPKQLSEKLNIPLNQVNLIRGLQDNPVSLNFPTKEGYDFLDLIPNYEKELDQQVGDNFLKEQIYLYINKLTKREQEVIYYRFGLKNIKPHTLDEVGKKIGITRERVRQIQQKALIKLRGFFEKDEFIL